MWRRFWRQEFPSATAPPPGSSDLTPCWFRLSFKGLGRWPEQRKARRQVWRGRGLVGDEQRRGVRAESLSRGSPHVLLGSACVQRSRRWWWGGVLRGVEDMLQKEGKERTHPHRAFRPAASPQQTSSPPASHVFSLSPSSLLLSLLAAPSVKGKRKQSEGGDPLDPPVSPQPDGEQSKSQSPIQLEVS